MLFLVEFVRKLKFPNKTDKSAPRSADALKLAHILEDCREERLPTVPVPSDEEMAKRKLVSSHRREQKCRTAANNRLHGMFVSQGITSMVRRTLRRPAGAGPRWRSSPAWNARRRNIS